MGRHSLSYIAAQQELPGGEPDGRRASAHIGRIGLLAVALGVGAAVAGGTATASADTPASNTSSDSSEQSSTQPAGKQRSQPSSSEDRDLSPRSGAGADNDPGAASETALSGVRRSSAVRASDDETVEVATPAKSRTSRQTAEPTETDETETDEPTDIAPVAPSAAVDAPVPSPEDQIATEYGDIGKWMLQPDGEIADYGGLPYEGRTVLESINVIIVDPTSRNTLEATWRLNAAMRRAGFPPRLFHSTGFRGLIDDRRYRQQPRGLLVGYSDDSFLVTNNHGRIFGPDPVETATGYVWSGAFSTEEFVFYQGLPRHGYVSSNLARSALAARLVASGRADLGEHLVSLDNSYNTETTTTGDHDGYAVVVILTDPTAVRAAAVPGPASADHGTCVAAGDPADVSVGTSCVAVAVAYRGGEAG